MAAKRGARNGEPVTLKPVAVSDDGSKLVLARRANAKRGAFRVAVNDELIEKIREAYRLSLEARARAAKASQDGPPPEDETPPPAEPAVRKSPPSKLTVKEIQELLRRGQAAATIAKKAGVDQAWVERFEGPIVWERAGIATRARKATLTKARRGPSAQPLGEAVVTNLRKRRVEMSPEEFEAAWTSVMRANHKWWMVAFSFFSRGRMHRARWEFDPEDNEVIALDNLARELGWVEGGRKRR